MQRFRPSDVKPLTSANLHIPDLEPHLDTACGWGDASQGDAVSRGYLLSERALGYHLLMLEGCSLRSGTEWRRDPHAHLPRTRSHIRSMAEGFHVLDGA